MSLSLNIIVCYRHERSWRVAIFFGGAALAGAFGGNDLEALDMHHDLLLINCRNIGVRHRENGWRGWEKRLGMVRPSLLISCYS